MSRSSPFTIYNASAGSGKTFALVKAYLKKIITNSQPGYYKHLLAITFTNKAVAEMKTRIIDTLVGFSSEEVPKPAKKMLGLLMEETALSETEIKSRSHIILKHLLHNYAQFSVETIDHFNHRLIRTFARDLNIAPNFEVSLDVQQLISQAVDQLIEKAGEEEEITNILMEFALQKTDDDKSWDIAIDLKKAASLLTNENDALHLTSLKDRSLMDFMTLRKKLKEQSGLIEQEIGQLADEVINLFHENGLDRTYFSGGYLFDFFHNLSSGEFQLNYDAAWQRNIGIKPMYPSRVKGAEAQLIDDLAPLIGDVFLKIKTHVFRYFLFKNILKNLVPLATIHLVNQELQHIKKEDNILPINEFNALIHTQIKDQPAPFIYERLGDRYRDFFIDEFQDTSLLQWNNLIPLIDNAISQAYEEETPGSLLLVGDAKQSIYRWRGGLPEQFIKLYETGAPFAISEGPTIKNLDTNYRSCQEIIEFNNDFFGFISGYFGDPGHQRLYEIGTKQNHTSKKGGYVKIEFIGEGPDDVPNKEELLEFYSKKVLQSIEKATALGFQKKDICVLTRKKKEGIALSEFLLENEIPIISEETLLLKNAPTVQCLIQILQLSIKPQDEEVKIELLEFIYRHLNVPGEKHTFFESLIHEPLEMLSEKLKEYSIDFNFKALQYLSLFEGFEYSIDALKLDTDADAFLTSFMDLVFSFSVGPVSHKSAFLDYWNTEMERASISENKSTNAVNVMTIHKSKGLEFPVVIFPYADIDIYYEKEATAWYPLNKNGFDDVLINYSKGVADYGEIGAQMVTERRNTLELDNLNLLYVALTRAEHQLYIFAKNQKPKEPPTTYNGLLKAFLLSSGRWDEASSVYEFGSLTNIPSELAEGEVQRVEIPYIVSQPEAHNIKVVASDVDRSPAETLRSINIGNLLHDTMALIKYSEDLGTVIQELELQLKDEPATFSEIRKMIVQIIQHPELSHLFGRSEKIHNEREIITPERIIRPDRINIHQDSTVTIVDYKTGTPKEAHEYQINSYAVALQDMGYPIKEKLLLYCSNDGILINKT